MVNFSETIFLEGFGNKLAERIFFHAELSPNFKPWTNAVYKSLREIAETNNWAIFPAKRCYAGEYLRDFMLFDHQYGCRIACESQWKHLGAGHLADLEWAFDKLRGVKSDLKLFVFEGTDDEWLTVIAKYLDGYAQLSLGEAFLALRWDRDRFTKWRWIVTKSGKQDSPIVFTKFGESVSKHSVNVLDVYGNNAAVRCPACSQTFVVSAMVNTGTSHAPTRHMLTAIYYFYRDPKLFTGGDLRLYDLRARPNSNPTSGPAAFVTITPEQNTLLVFPSELGHEVMPVIQSTGNFADFRFVVNCWLHRAS